MSVYTELILGCSLKLDTPVEIIDSLKALGEGQQLKGQDFTSPFVHHSWSFPCYIPLTLTNERLWVVNARGNLKNYTGNIDLFLTWLRPWVSEGSGSNDCYAITFVEGCPDPVLWCLRNDKLETY